MRQLAEYIFRQIKLNVSGSGTKHVFRVEGFEDLGLYAKVCELTSAHFDSVHFIAKLSQAKFDQLKDSNPYAANVMKGNGWVDFDDRMTYYRNLVPEAGERMVILLLGTDVVADKGGLSDFYAITPHTIDLAIGNRFSELMGQNLRDVIYGGDEAVPKTCDAFFRALFACVPRNLAKVSAIMDTWETEMPTPKEIISNLYYDLPEWGIPRIEDAAQRITPAKLSSGKFDQKILREADQFIKGKTFARITRSTQANVAGKFTRYRDKPGRYADDYPVGQAASSLDDLEKAVLDFIAGDRNAETMRQLLYTDFSILSDVLAIKASKKKTEKAIPLRGNPLIAFGSAILYTLSMLEDEEAARVNTIRVQLDKVYMSGIPAVSSSGDDRDELLLEAWHKVTRFSGGVFSFIMKEDWEMGEDTLLHIESSPENFTDPDKASELLNRGQLTNGSGNMHRVEFTVIIMDGQDTIADVDFCWKIDPQEDWMTAFTHLPYMMSFGNSYIPYVVMPRLNAVFSIKDEDGFAFFIEHEKISFPEERKSLTELMRASISNTADEQKELGNFYALGMAFVSFLNAMDKNGFYAAIDREIPALINSYIKLARHIAEASIYATKLRHCVKYFVNAFTICPDGNPLTSDIYIRQAIVPPYHPAALEKISDRMLFIRAGLKEWFAQEKRTVKSLTDTIDRLTSLSRVHNATDGFFSRSDVVLPHNRTFGYYTLYGEPLQNGKFISAQDIMRREMVFEDDFDDAELNQLSRESKALLRVIEQYIETYPRCDEQLTVSFINPGDLQIVVSALHKFISDRKKATDDAPFQLALTIITRSEMYGARAYLSYWINNVFTQDDNIDIKAYIRFYDEDREIPALVPEATDLVFLFDALNTQRNAGCTFRPKGALEGDIMMDCRFPMVFKPGVSMANSNEHTIDITQWQFQAATAHTQVLRAYQNGFANDRPYELLQSSTVEPGRSNIIQKLQERSIWLVCIDDAIDKHTIRTLYAKDTDIIGFTTGEGSFGQMNLAITGKPELKADMLKRCKRRLQIMFRNRWDDEKLTAAADHCIRKARELDGVSILRAMNPYDYNINNYMAYLVADEICADKSHKLNVLINLDSYRHWFRGDRGTDSKIPDFLLLTADICPDTTLHFHATVIEAKLSKLSNMHEHLTKAAEQVRQGLRLLKHHFDPQSRSIEHRYWIAQLYRAIVFLQADMDYEDSVFRSLTEQLSQMMENHYEITWSSRILAMELDSPRYLDKDFYEDIECWHVGQYAFQNILLSRDLNAQAEYVEDISIDEGEEGEGEMLWEDIPSEPVSLPETGPESIAPDVEDTPVATDPTDVPDIPVPADPTDVPDTPVASQDRTTEIQSPEVTPTVEEELIEPEENNETTNTRLSGQLPLSQIRVPIGTDKAGNIVNWEFGHPNLANRHLLITGGSGQGKTYAIQTFLYELAKQGISSVVFDYTDGFLPDKLEPPFAKALEGKIEQHIAILSRIPINPFRRQTITIAGFSKEEPSTLAAGRFAAIMKHVYSFGEQQYSALYQACKLGIDRYGDVMSFKKLREILGSDSSNYAKTVLSKMQQLFDLDLFDVENAFDWAKITERDGKVTVIQLTNLDREIQTVITEMLMWDAWYSLVKTGNKDRPFVVVLDEAQNLSIADGSPAQKILQEGRKYGWSAWFATQFLKGALSSDEISRLQQAAEVLYFKPTGEETSWVGQQLADGSMDAASWTQLIKKMQKGHCIVRGDRIRSNGVFGAAPATMVGVSSFESRH